MNHETEITPELVDADRELWKGAQITVTSSGPQAWQPIATVPKDGTRVMVYDAKRGRTGCIVADWDMRLGCLSSHPGRYCIDSATHWALLPEPPT